jgi:hypothetical protein
MASYQVNLTPKLRNYTTEGGLDTTVVNGVSLQRTVNMVMTVDGSARKVVKQVVDGGSFTDTVQSLTDLDFLV